jgi:hypothetical protein
LSLQVFVADLEKHAGVKINLNTDTAAAGPSSSPPKPQALETKEQMTDPVFQAAQHGYTIDVNIYNKADPNLLYAIETVSADIIDCVEVTYKESKQSIRIQMEDLYSWKISKKRLCAELDGWGPESLFSPMNNASWQIDILKGVLQLALRNRYDKYESEVPMLSLMKSPFHVRMRTACDVGSIHLVAATQRIEKKATSGSVGVGSFSLRDGSSIDLFATPQITPPLLKDGKEAKNAWVVPFWFCVQTNAKKEANMELKWETVNMGFNVVCQVPMLVNSRKLVVGDELKYYIKAGTQWTPCPASKAPSPASKKLKV